MYHAIIINKQFIDENYPNTKNIFAKKVSGDWEIYGIEVEDSNLYQVIREIQENTRSNEPWYAHFYNNKDLIVVFKEKVFYVTPDKSTWSDLLEYAKTLGIPDDQMNIVPVKYGDEKAYFE